MGNCVSTPRLRSATTRLRSATARLRSATPKNPFTRRRAPVRRVQISRPMNLRSRKPKHSRANLPSYRKQHGKNGGSGGRHPGDSGKSHGKRRKTKKQSRFDAAVVDSLTGVPEAELQRLMGADRREQERRKRRKQAKQGQQQQKTSDWAEPMYDLSKMQETAATRVKNRQKWDAARVKKNDWRDELPVQHKPAYDIWGGWV